MRFQDHSALSSLLLAILSSGCHSLATLEEEGEVPPLLVSKSIKSNDVTPITATAFPDSDEHSPMVVDESTFVFVSDGYGNLDVFQMSYNSSKVSGQSEIVVTESDEKAPFVVSLRGADGALERRCVYVTDASSKFEIYSGPLPRVQIQTALARPPRHANYPTYDSGGERMLYSALDRRDRYQTWLQDSSGVKLVADGQRARWNPVVPDRFVYTAKTGDTWQVFQRDLDSGNTEQLTTGPDNFDPQYSPDGRFIAYTSNQQGSSDIWIMKADGSDPQQLTAHGAADCQPDWSPDGRWILFASNRGESWDVWKIASGVQASHVTP